MDWISLALPLFRGLALTALISAFGAALFRIVVAPAALTAVSPTDAGEGRAGLLRVLRSSLLAALVATLIWLPVEAASMAGCTSLSGGFAATPLVLFGTHLGKAVLWRLGALIVALALARNRGNRWDIGAVVAAGLALGLQAEMGHPAAANDLALPVASIFHLLAAGAWLGGLLPLLLLIRRLPGAPAEIAARRFSLVGILAVAVLVCTALVQAGGLIGSFAGLLGSDYGRSALAKTALFLLLLALAGANRFDFTPHLNGSDARLYSRRLGLSIVLEMSVGLVILFLAARLATQVPALHELPVWPFQVRPEWRLFAGASPTVEGAAFAVLALAALGAAGAGWRRFHRKGALAAAVAIFGLAATQVGLVALPDLVEGTGTVIATDPSARSLTVDADAIPGFMAAMTMPYPVSSASLLDHLNPDERVQFDIDRKTQTITAIRPAKPSGVETAQNSRPTVTPVPVRVATSAVSDAPPYADQVGLNAERAKIPGAADNAVEIAALSDGSRQVTIRLEIIEVQEEVYPGKFVLFWVFAPLGDGMNSPARMPSPTLRVQEGDHVRIVLYNTHYFPHTIHFHGLSVPSAMDGTPDFSQAEVEPGKNFTYEFVAKYPGTYWYHCHVDPSVHALMGLSGMLIVEPKRPDNHFAPVIVGAGRIEPMAKGTAEQYQGEYSLVYQDVDDRLNRIALAYTDPREVEMRMHRDYDSSQRKPDIFLLNGRSFPFTLRDTPILVKPNQVTLLRILNAGARTMAFHTHGHHPIVTALDGDPLPPALQYSRDTFEIAPAQRIDLALHTGDDGRYAAGPGVWMVHDHTAAAEVNGGIDGGDMTAIVYDGFMAANGLPKMTGNIDMMFNPDFYRGKMPMFDARIFGTDAAHYDQGLPAAPLGGAFDYPHRQDDDGGLPNLGLIETQRHQVVSDSCKQQPRSAQVITIKAGRAYARPGEVYAFAPRIVHVERCQAVTVILENTDDIRHDFMIPGLDPMMMINFIGPDREEATFVTPDADVTLVYHCDVSTHERHGMLGYLIVGKGAPLAPSQADGIVPSERLETMLAEAEQPAPPAAPQSASQVQSMMSAQPIQPSGADKVYTGTGLVISTIPRSGQLILNGDAIPGFMAAMVMGYKVADPSLLEGLNPQDKVGFSIDASTSTITKIEVLQHAQ